MLMTVTWAVVLGAGCATVSIDDARRQFSAGQLDTAEQTLANLPENGDLVLNLMERGMIRHLREDYTGSTMDWLRAVRLEENLETHSLSKAGASMVVNDNALAFRGYPYERTYLHVFLARNYLAQGMWDDAAVEARSIIRKLEHREGFPDDAYSRFMAGLCLELTGDSSGAALQYRTASGLMTDWAIDENTGRFVPAGSNTPPLMARTETELVCLVDLDGGRGAIPSYAEIHAGGRRIGITHTLARTAQLDWESSQCTAARRMAKQVARVAVKETLATAVEYQNEDLGRLLRFLLYALEAPDERRWQTLPNKLAVARCPCPADLKSFEVVFKTAEGMTLSQMTVGAPLTRRDRVFVSMCRDAP